MRAHRVGAREAQPAVRLSLARCHEKPGPRDARYGLLEDAQEVFEEAVRDHNYAPAVLTSLEHPGPGSRRALRLSGGELADGATSL